MAQKTVAYTTGVTPGSYTSADITVDNQGLITTVANGSGSLPANTWLPSDYVASGLTWSYDPGKSSGAALGMTSGRMYVTRIKLPAGVSVSNISVYFTSSNTATFTTGQNFMGIYQSNALVGSSADQAAAWQGSGTGVKTAAIVGAPIALSAGFVDVVILTVFSAGGVSVQNTSFFTQFDFAAPNLRTALQSGITALPADLNSTTTTNAQVWFVLS